MIAIEIEFNSQSGDIAIRMPYLALMNMFHVITEKIHPEDLDNDDSFGELVLTEFIRKLFELNTDLIDKGAKCETEDAIAEAENIVNPERRE